MVERITPGTTEANLEEAQEGSQEPETSIEEKTVKDTRLGERLMAGILDKHPNESIPLNTFQNVSVTICTPGEMGFGEISPNSKFVEFSFSNPLDYDKIIAHMEKSGVPCQKKGRALDVMYLQEEHQKYAPYFAPILTLPALQEVNQMTIHEVYFGDHVPSLLETKPCSQYIGLLMD